jgi:hypothetical protein
MRLAARLWAGARQRGFVSAPDKDLDADVILAAQALRLRTPPGNLIIATTNIRHLAPFVAAKRWQDI